MRKIGVFESVPRLLDFIIFFCENEHSTDTLPTGTVRQTFARVLKLGHTVSSIELVETPSTAHLYLT